MVRGVVRAVDGGIGAAGHGAGIEDERLIEDIEADRRFGQEALLIIGAGNHAKECSSRTAKDTHSDRCNMHVAVGESGVEVEIGHRAMGPILC